MPNEIIPPELAIRAMRDSGYRSTAYAIAELIDNAVQAGASLIEVFAVEERTLITERSRRRMKELAVLDNGSGMTPAILQLALQFGNGTHLSDRSGIGRFGMGLPNASISQGRRVDVWTWQSGPDNAMHCYLDVEEVENRTFREIPAPRNEAVPANWRALSRGLGTAGTLVVWSKLDEARMTWKSARSTLENSEALIGRIYRRFISRGDLEIRLCATDGSVHSLDRSARVNDPLYLMAPSSTPAPFNDKPMFLEYGKTDFLLNGQTVSVRASVALPATFPNDGIERGAKDYGKHAARNVGVSIVRADRELDLDPSWTISYDPRERWWGLEVEFPPALDEVFGVTNNKQAATIFSHMSSFDWKTEAEPGEEFSDYTKRLESEADPRAGLIAVVNHIRDTLNLLRKAVSDQGKDRRSSKRHDETSVEDRASTKFKERAAAGHKAEADDELFDAKAKEALVKDLVGGKQYAEEVAQNIADAVSRRGRTVLFLSAHSDMDAFFSVDPKPGGITEVVFNGAHPAHASLIKALETDTAEASDRDLIERVQNASDTLKMLFAAWARFEIEDMPNRERLRRMRQDWGRMSRDFLTDGDD